MADRSQWPERLRLLLIAGLLAPAAMIMAGMALAYFTRRDLLDLAQWPSWGAVGLAVLTAVISLGMITLLYKSNKTLERALRKSSVQVGQEALRAAGYPVMLVMVIGAGVGEEALFRGGLQPLIGLIPAALLFGFSHGGWRREMWAYAVVASFSGGVFGLVYYLSGDLWIPIIAHALHNVFSTVLLGKDVDFSWDGAMPRVRLVSVESGADEEFPASQAVAVDDAMDESSLPEGGCDKQG